MTKVLKLLQLLPLLPAGVWFVLLAALGLLVYGGLALRKRRIGRAIAFGGAGVLVLWAMTAMLVRDEPTRRSPGGGAADPQATLRLLQGVVGLCVAGGGLAALAGGVGMLKDLRRFLASAVRTEGRIVDIGTRISRTSDGRETWVYSPIVEYRTAQGETRRFEHDVWESRQPTRGRSVAVYYDPSNPDDARLKSVFRLWIVPLLVGALGLVFAAAGAFMIVAKPE